MRFASAPGLSAWLAIGAAWAAPASNAANPAAAPSQPMQIILLLTGLTLLPAVLVSLTPFLRISLVLHFLRQALGTQTAPSNQVLAGLSLFLSLLLVQPVVRQAYEQGWKPFEQGKMSAEQAWEQGTRPVRDYLLRFAREKDLALMVEITKTAPPANPRELGLAVVAPAYVLSELRRGFQIGAVLFLPFLIIDLVVASVTLSIGMVQLPPVMVSAPLKLLLFVLVDGWNLVVGSLVRTL
ncbi:MAG: flagellar type III secretion system pore protein FliP [Bryobacteraceae bacterium]|nr:flagellar type III secretion system pore protein FliP [Bryobacteraceae bacterium]MCX7604289.1 flagellar type III secretion system pore protein FliP [Bryobacteraceae bacterium]